jgi:hypothetical protein
MKDISMIFKNLKYLKILIFFFIMSSHARGEDKEAASTAPNKAALPEEPFKVRNQATELYMPRHFYMKPVVYSLKKGGKESLTLKIGFPYRYQIILLLASWNDSSKKISVYLNEQFDRLSKHWIGVFGVFSHDTQESVDDWIREVKPLYPMGFAKMSFIDALGNPKIPTIWVVDPRNVIIRELEMPELDHVKEVVKSLYTMTNF